MPNYGFDRRTLGTDVWLALETFANAGGWGAGMSDANRNSMIRSATIRVIDDNYHHTSFLRMLEDPVAYERFERQINRAWPDGHSWPIRREVMVTRAETFAHPNQDPDPRLIGLADGNVWQACVAWVKSGYGLPMPWGCSNPVDTLESYLLTHLSEFGVDADPDLARPLDRTLRRKTLVSLLGSWRLQRTLDTVVAGAQFALTDDLFMHHRFGRQNEGESVFFERPWPTRATVTMTGENVIDGGGDVRVARNDIAPGSGTMEQSVSLTCLRPLNLERVGAPVEVPGASERIAGLEAALTEARRAHEHDIERIASVFWREAHKRHWCAEAEAAIRVINRDMNLHFPDNRDAYRPLTRYQVSGYAQVQITVDGETWECSNHDFNVTTDPVASHDEARAWVEDSENWNEIRDNVQGRSAISGGDWSIEGITDVHDIEPDDDDDED